ncbi:MAG: Rossmann-like and DUF2520 domain-containing protein [Pyrinomonadaceae bacterium]
MPRPAQKEETKPTVSVVGAGRLGTALGRAMFLAGYRIQALVSRRASHATAAAAVVGSATMALTANQLHLLPPSKLILITTPDDRVAITAQKLALLQKGLVQGATVLHTSGALSADVLSPLAETGFHLGSLHPLISVSDSRAGSENFTGAFFCLEGDAAAVRVARAIVRDLKGESFSIPSHSKPLYHAAAVMASGHVVALFDLAITMLVQCGLSETKARRALLPLLQSTVRNLVKSDPAHALTGTFARGDLATVQRHLKALSAAGLAAPLETYNVLGRRSLELVKDNGLDPQVLKQIKRELKLAAARKK